MSDARLRMLARAAAGVSLLLALGLLGLVALLGTDDAYPRSQSFWDGLPDVLMAVAYALVGVIVTLKRPSNLVGWALVLAGVGSLLGGVLDAYGELALLAKPDAGIPGGAAAAGLSAGLWTPLMAGVFLLLMTFPSGTLPSARARRFATAVLLGFAAVWVMISTSATDLPAPFQAFENPLALTQSPLYAGATIPIIVACLLSLVTAGVLALRRFRRSAGQERLQFKWLATSAGLLIVTLPFAALFNWSRIAGLVFGVELIALPVSVGIAVLRYRLYEIDVIIRRTLVYGALSVLLAGTYAATVIGLQALLSPIAGGSNLAIAVSTLAVAALFLPVRSRVQRFVDRRFYRRRYDAQRTLQGFGARVREQVDLEMLGVELRSAIDETMQPHTSLSGCARARSDPRRRMAVVRRRCGGRADRRRARPRGGTTRARLATGQGVGAVHRADRVVWRVPVRGGRSPDRAKECPNPIGWLFLASSPLLALIGLAYAYADLALYGGEDWPGAVWAAWLASWLVIVPVFVGAVPHRTTLPGRPLRRRRWRCVLRLSVVIGLYLGLAPALDEGRLGSYPTVENPAALPHGSVAVRARPHMGNAIFRSSYSRSLRSSCASAVLVEWSESS